MSYKEKRHLNVVASLLLTLLFLCLKGQAQDILYFTAVQGKSSKIEQVRLGKLNPHKQRISMSGTEKEWFEVGTIETDSTTGLTYCTITFVPGSDFRGIAQATLSLGKKDRAISLSGLSMPGLEGKNEPTLSEVFQALNISTDPGWSTLAHHTNLELQGAELNSHLFEKAGTGPVTLLPVARFSDPCSLPFGYYHCIPAGPELHQIGILSDSKQFQEHQTLLPKIASGGSSFDPGDHPFGIYVVNPTHNSLSEDYWNQLKFPEKAGHAVRVYPAKDKMGNVVENSYLVCFEEGANGDYQDYVFLLKNVMPIDPKSGFESLLNEDDLDGWDTFLQTKGVNDDPENIFTIADGELHDMGKELGYMITKRSFANYHFRLQFKWGEKKWPPRDSLKRDSGICYHIPEFEDHKIWPQSIECQVQEGDVGDFWLLGYSTIEVDGVQNVPYRHSRMTKSKDNEWPNGEWNTVEVITFNGTCVHIVNGVVVNYGTNSSLRKGRILLQSEYAEVFYRNVEIKEL